MMQSSTRSFLHNAGCLEMKHVSLLLALLLGACATAQRPDLPIGMTLPELLWRIQQGEAVLARLPAPLEERTVRQENIHDPRQIDTVRQLAYPGLLLTVYEPGGDSARQMVTAVIVTEPGLATAEGIQVGSSLQELSDAYGQADLLEGDEYVYRPEGSSLGSVRFRVQGERVVRMEWEFYVD